MESIPCPRGNDVPKTCLCLPPVLGERSWLMLLVSVAVQLTTLLQQRRSGRTNSELSTSCATSSLFNSIRCARVSSLAVERIYLIWCTIHIGGSYISFMRFAGRARLSSGRPLRFVPGRLLVRMSLSSWLTRRCGYCSLTPSKQLLETLSPVLKKGCLSACCAERRFSGSYSSRDESSL